MCPCTDLLNWPKHICASGVVSTPRAAHFFLWPSSVEQRCFDQDFNRARSETCWRSAGHLLVPRPVALACSSSSIDESSSKREFCLEANQQHGQTGHGKRYAPLGLPVAPVSILRRTRALPASLFLARKSPAPNSQNQARGIVEHRSRHVFDAVDEPLIRGRQRPCLAKVTPGLAARSVCLPRAEHGKGQGALADQ
jgi:hypothetical protein